MTQHLPDGVYDAFVVDLVDERTPDGRDRSHLDLTIVSGEHKGLVLKVSTDAPIGRVEDVIGMPATLRVRGGAPSVTIDA